MRCLVLGALVMIASTACGGPSEEPSLRSPQTDLRKEWAARSPADQAAIRKYSAAFGEDAVDTCVRVFDDDSALQERMPFNKPSAADLAVFLCSCVGATTCL